MVNNQQQNPDNYTVRRELQGWVSDWAAQSRPEASDKPETSHAPLRVSLLDSAGLDEELRALALHQVYQALKVIAPSSYQDVRAEVELLVDTTMFASMVLHNSTTPGAALLNLHYTSTHPTSPSRFQAQKLLLYVLQIVIPYLGHRLGDLLPLRPSGHTVAALTGRPPPTLLQRLADPRALGRGLDQVWHVAQLVHMCAFLRFGGPRTLHERLAGVHLTHGQQVKPRWVNYDYLNRQLVWKEVSGVVLTWLAVAQMPVVRRWKRKVVQLVYRGQGDVGSQATATDSQLGVHKCGICSARDMVTPVVASPCEHVFDYYCLKRHMLQDPECPICFQTITNIERVG